MVMSITGDSTAIIMEVLFVEVVSQAVFEELGFGGRILAERAFLVGAIG